jgi:hypothetical protein
MTTNDEKYVVEIATPRFMQALLCCNAKNVTRQERKWWQFVTGITVTFP